MLLLVHEYTLCVCIMEQAFEILLEEMKLDTDVLEETFRFTTRIKINVGLLLSILLLSRIANITLPCCVTTVGLCKIIEKSVMGESFVFCPVRLDPRLDS